MEDVVNIVKREFGLFLLGKGVVYLGIKDSSLMTSAKRLKCEQ